VTRPTLGGALGVLFVTAGVAVGMRSLADNSFLTHLATGRLILDTGSVPSHDPYTFTAAGEPWVVQSWLASVLYASVERLAGLDGVRVLMGCLAGLLAGLSWSLLRPASGVVGRLAVGAMTLAVGAGLWTERPYILGLIAFAFVALAAEGRLSPVWLLPIGWAWVNVHGSFPLGIVYLVLVGVGTRLDGGSPSTELRCLRWVVPGMLAGAVGPLGPGVLLFPLHLLGRQDLLANVIEWQAPAFTSASERAFLLQVMTAVVLLARRPAYRGALVVAVFTAAALLGSRNVVVASLALLPTMAVGLRGLGSLSSDDRPGYARPLAAVGVAVAVLAIVGRLALAPLELGKYPVDAVAYLEERHVDLVDHHLAAPDFVGNFLEYVYGARGQVFYDDRFDMFPQPASEAALALARVESDVFDRLAQYDVELIAMPHSSPMALVLALEPGWRTVYTDEDWMLACRRDADLGGSLGTC
jgi:hypothetical protein